MNEPNSRHILFLRFVFLFYWQIIFKLNFIFLERSKILWQWNKKKK